MGDTQTKEQPVGTYTPNDDERTIIEKWKRRFNLAERVQKPYREKNLRMWKLYRGYRDALNYAYQTSIMPPIGFEIVETIKPRLAASRMRTRLFPVSKDDVNNTDAIEEWDSLVNYQLDDMDFDEKKSDWIDTMLKYGDGYAVMNWKRKGPDDGDPSMTIWDNWLFYHDPAAGPRLKNSGWEILQSFKKKEKIIKEEKKRAGVTDTENTENQDTQGLYKGLEFVTNKDNRGNDPRRERYELETLKMAQIQSANKPQAADDTQTSATDEREEEKNVEIWLCLDHDTDEILTIMNREVLVRKEESPYKEINDGRLVVVLPCIRVPWSAHSMAILEPVETTIYEIADGRNQAMDNIVFNLNPIRKVRKGAQIDQDDLVSAPGAIWEMENTDDVVLERGSGLDNTWLDRESLLRKDIETSLALSEYVRGVPQSTTEPMGKVELLLMQSSIRFSQFVRQMEIAIGEMVNIMIEMDRAFLPEEKAYRVLGETVDFKDFKSKEVQVDAQVEIEPKPEDTPAQRKAEILGLYKLFVAEDPPVQGDPQSITQFTKKKRAMQKMVLEEYDKEQYEDVILGPDVAQQPAQEPTVPNQTAAPDMTEIPPIDMSTIIPQATTPQTEPRQQVVDSLIQKAQ